MKAKDAQAIIWAAMSEEQFRIDVRQACKRLGWPIRYHVYKSQKSDPGFPDMVIARALPRPRLIIAELKRQDGRLSLAQQTVLAVFRAIAAHIPDILEVYVWRPSDWDDILRILQP